MTKLVTIALALLSAAPAAAQWTTESVLRTMRPLIQPEVQPTTGPRVFTLAFDTHSSVHAHWAAYRIARKLPDQQRIAFDSEAALEPAKVALEVAQYVTYPYAEAWFLLLAVEYEQWCREESRPDPARLVVHGNTVAARLLARYEALPSLGVGGEYDNVPWHLLQLHRWFEHAQDAPRLARTDTLIRANFLGVITPTLRRDVVQPTMFFSPHGNTAHLVMETQDPATITAFVATQGPYPNSHIVPNALSAFPHSFGLGWSRAWALRSMARHASSPVDRARFWRAAEAHVQLGMARHLGVPWNFATYGHWVPQFAVYAVTEGP